jgi:hypothetical protein
MSLLTLTEMHLLAAGTVSSSSGKGCVLRCHCANHAYMRCDCCCLQIGSADDWQCISCRQAEACAAKGCSWCTQHNPQSSKRICISKEWAKLHEELQQA